MPLADGLLKQGGLPCPPGGVFWPAMDTTLLEEHLGRLGWHLEPAQRERFCRYYRELLDWNQRVHLTTIVGWEEVQVQHFFDSLTCLPHLPAQAWQAPYRMVDIGAGAGFPGLPLKIFLPHVGLTLIESVAKKTAFLRHLVQVLGLEAVQVLTCRAEEAGRSPSHREAYDLALARAVAGLPTLVEYALPLVRPGGFFVAYKGREVEEEVSQAQTALDLLGGRLSAICPVEVPGLEAPRHLVIIEKVSPTPERFPRRPGLPAKRPLR